MDWLELVEGSLLSFSLILFKLYDSFATRYFYLIPHLSGLKRSYLFVIVELGKYSPTNGAGSEEGEEETWNYRTHVSGFVFHEIEL